MATLRLIKPAPPAVAPDEARIRLASLPTPLRAVVRDRSETCTTLAAELPWLAVGTPVNVELSDGSEQVGSVQSFDVEVTKSGSARLLIFAAPSPTGAHPAGARRSAPPRTSGRRWVTVAALVLVAMGSFWVGQLSTPLTLP